MAQPASSPKIDELRSRLRSEPNSRIFYPLAEELRKAGEIAESEQVLRAGLANHQTYLAAWVSLGRVLREQKRDGEAVEPLLRAMQLDPANVVAARLLADCYFDLGDKVEAIKKYKLVQALMPGDEELANFVENLDRELNPPAETPAFEAAPEPAPEPATVPDFSNAIAGDSAAEEELPWASSGFGSHSPVSDDARPGGAFEEPLPLASAAAAIADERAVEEATGDVEPMLAAHDESPFEEPVDSYSAAAVEIEAPPGMQIGRAPLAADVPALVAEEEQLPVIDAAPVASPLESGAPASDLFAEPAPSIGVKAFEEASFALTVETAASPLDQAPASDEADVFAPASEPFGEAEESKAGPGDDLTNTITMADLYVRQGLVDDARQIYESLLIRDPGNAGVRARLESLSRPAGPEPKEEKIQRLEKWLARVARREVGRV